jgi:hypothetical protein
MATKNYVTYKDKYNKKYGYAKNTSHTLEEVSKDTGVSMKGLQQIYNKGIGAYKTNPSSVRPNVKSKEQWAMARVYSAVMGGKASNIDSNELKMEKGGLIAPNGKKSNLTAQQYKLVRTKAFKDWFGDWENDPANASKVVDDNGEPLVVYHGSERDYDIFDKEKTYDSRGYLTITGFYFTTNKEEAKEYGKPKSYFLNLKIISSTNNGIESDYTLNKTKIKKILKNHILKETTRGETYYQFVDKTLEEKIDIISRKKDITKQLYDIWFEFFNYLDEWDDENKKWKKSNKLSLFYDALTNSKVLDGVKLYFDKRKPYLGYYVAFQPNQIKLADGSNTTFDGKNPDIRFDEGGAIGVQTSKLIEELKKYSNYEQGEISTNAEGEKYRYHYWKLKYRSASNWLVQLFMRASKENTGVDYKQRFAVGDYSFYYDRPEMKGKPNGSMQMRKLEVLGKYEKGGMTRKYAEGGKITQYEIQSMRNYINSENPNPKIKASFEKVLAKYQVEANRSDLSAFPQGKYINPYEFSGYEYMRGLNEEAGVSFLLTGEYELVSKAIYEKDYAMWLFYSYLGRINISFKACQDWLNQAQEYFQYTMPIPIWLVHTPRAKDGRSYAMWWAVSEDRKAQAESRVGRPLVFDYNGTYYYQEIGMVGNFDGNNDGWGTLYKEKKTGLLIPEYTETSFHFSTLIHEFAHCLDFQTQLVENIEKFKLKPVKAETYLNTEKMTDSELALYSKQIEKESKQGEGVSRPITNHFDEFVDALIRILRACAGGHIPLTQLYEQQALDVQQALAGTYGDLLLAQRERLAKERKELAKEDELRENKRFSWQSSWINDIKQYVIDNALQIDLKEKLNRNAKINFTLTEAIELDNLITGYFNTEFRKYRITNPSKATQRLEDIKMLKKETNRIINNHYDNVKSGYRYGFSPQNELEKYIDANCKIRDFRDYKSWKECAKESLQNFQ